MPSDVVFSPSGFQEKENEARAQKLKMSLSKQTSSRYRAPSVSRDPVPMLPLSPRKLHREFGAVPAYLKRFHVVEAARHREEEDARQAASIPAGCRYMTPDEKDRTLLDLENKREELLTELKSLPLTMSTLRQRRCKLEAELKLDEVERLLEKFKKGRILLKSTDLV
jgi:hypothetical protein